MEITDSGRASSPPPAATATRSDLLEITAPMVGTFYRAPAPGEPPFVEVGNRIEAGQTVCILEAMKLMNELEAELSGEVVEILVDNGTPVEFGQVLMRVRPALGRCESRPPAGPRSCCRSRAIPCPAISNPVP